MRLPIVVAVLEASSRAPLRSFSGRGEVRIVLPELLLRRRDQAEIVLGVLIVIFGRDRIAGGLRVARKLKYFSAMWMALPRIFTSGPFDS